MQLKPLPATDLHSILEQTADLWEAERNCRIFLTGGTGFFGAWLVESFCHINRALRLNGELVVLTRRPAALAAACPHVFADAAVHLHEGDVRTFAFPSGGFTCIVHAATDTRTTVQASESFSTIVHGTQRVLEFAIEAGAEKFLLTSSGAVYGSQPPQLTHVPETYTGAPDPVAPNSVYGESKRAAEMLCSIYSSRNLACKIARCWAFCGARLPLDQHFAIGNFIGDVLAGGPIRISGDGTPRRSYLYASDLAVWLWTILLRGKPLEAINVGSSCDLSILELAETVVRTLNPETEIKVAQPPRPDAAIARYVPSVDRARDELGLRQTVGLEEMIRRTAQWHCV
jgi:nucleoside-diphosphate-sugar epimerase